MIDNKGSGADSSELGSLEESPEELVLMEQSISPSDESSTAASTSPETDPAHQCSQAMVDLQQLRAVLASGSIVDSGGLYYPDRASVDQFLRLSGFDTDNSLDLQRLRELHLEAIAYLADIHSYRIPEDVQYPAEIHDLFLVASSGAGRSRLMACMTLKTMHIMHHVNARQLVFNTPISEAELFSRINSRVFEVIDEIRALGITVSEFTAGQKSRESITTKLLAKKEALATQLFDRLRFRIVVESHQDLIPALLYLLRNLVPYNYILPGQSQNGLVSTEDLAEATGIPEATISSLWDGSEISRSLGPGPTPLNEFSGRDFQCINFVAEIPLRIDDVAPGAPPAIAFTQAEIQLVDKETHQANNAGENAHVLYKERQRRRVRQRIQGHNEEVLRQLRGVHKELD